LVREVEPGEIVRLDKNGLDSRFFVTPGTVTPAHCIFEHIYFAKQNSTIFGENVHELRKKLGRQLAPSKARYLSIWGWSGAIISAEHLSRRNREQEN